MRRDEAEKLVDAFSDARRHRQAVERSGTGPELDAAIKAENVAYNALISALTTESEKSPGAGGKFDHLPLLTEQELDWYELHQIVLEANGEAKLETVRLWARIFATCRAGIRAIRDGQVQDVVGEAAEVVSLPGVDSTPEIMLGKLMGYRSKIEALVITVKWKEGSHQVCWTSQSLGSLSMAALATHRTLTDQIMK